MGFLKSTVYKCDRCGKEYNIPPQKCACDYPYQKGNVINWALLLTDKVDTTIKVKCLLCGEEKDILFRDADLFILPTFSENYGVVVAEALSYGIPVITTKGAPWEGLVSYHCGWWVDIGVEPLAKALREAVSLSGYERRAMGARGRQLVEARYAWSSVAMDMKAVYEWTLGGGRAPSCVLTV